MTYECTLANPISQVLRYLAVEAAYLETSLRNAESEALRTRLDRTPNRCATALASRENSDFGFAIFRETGLTKLSPVQKPCDKMTEAIVMDGGKRGQVVEVCADLTCPVRHPNTPSPQQVERQGAEERNRIERTGWQLRLAIVSWLRVCNAYRLH